MVACCAAVHAAVSCSDEPRDFPACVQGALQRLVAMGCDTICSVTIQLPAGSPLHEINLSQCNQLSKATISADGLQSLNLQQCSSLMELDLSCAHLRCTAEWHVEAAHCTRDLLQSNSCL